MSQPRVIVIGTVDFTHHCLRELLELPVDVRAVVTDAPERNRFNSDYRDLRPLAEAAGIEVRTEFDPAASETVEWAGSLNLDAVLVFGWSRLIPMRFLATARLGGIGTHPSPLPMGRGRHPIVWTLVKGLSTGGLSFFRLTEGADEGALVAQGLFEVTVYDDAGTVYDKVKREATRRLPEVVAVLRERSPRFTEQDEDRATVWPRRSEEDGKIRWDDDVTAAYNLIRALTHPYVGALAEMEGKPVRVWRALPPFAESLDPADAFAAAGTVLSVRGGRARVRCGDGAITLVDVREDAGATVALRAGQVFSA